MVEDDRFRNGMGFMMLIVSAAVVAVRLT